MKIDQYFLADKKVDAIKVEHDSGVDIMLEKSDGNAIHLMLSKEQWEKLKEASR